MTKLLHKFKLVIWKLFVVKSRHKSATILEVAVPVLFVIALSYFLPGDWSKQHIKLFTPQDLSEVLNSSLLKKYSTHVLYAPSTDFTNELMYSMANSTRLEIIGMDNEYEILKIFNTSDYAKTISVIFDDVEGAELPKTLKYRYRMKSGKSLKTNNQESGQHTDTGIGPLQLYIDNSFIDIVRRKAAINNKDLNITRLVQKFPGVHSSLFTPDFMSNLLAPIFVYAFLIVSHSKLLTCIVHDKEIGVTVFMGLHGLKTWINLTCLLVTTLLLNSISISFIALVLKFGVGEVSPLFQKSDYVLLYIFLVMFCISSILFIFAISSFFQNATWAVLFGFILYLVPLFLTSYVSDSAGRAVDFLLCLLPPAGFSFGIRVLSEYELTGNGLQWKDFNIPSVANRNHITMGDVFIAWSLVIIIFIFVTLYMNTVKPGKYGVARPWYYLCYACFSDESTKNMEQQVNVAENFENPTDNLKVGIQITDLFKIYKSQGKSESKVAVNGVTLDIYHGEITALLGHNGAGKTTLMSILSGMFSATSGSVMINGQDTKKNMEQIRNNLGLCPQNSILLYDLTVEEHLIFFGMLKGLSLEDAKDMADDILKKLDFAEKRHSLPAKLSGGMKRKLSLGIAMTGDAEILIMDEPTSGMDAEIRREVWNMLLSMRGHKTILISTHYLEEADVLGDRVAIMDHGKIKCYGSTLFLKRLYGTGYNLSIIKLDGCNESAVWEAITSKIQTATVKKLNGPVMYFSMPLDQTPNFPKLFDTLEDKKEELRIGGIGVSLTTLEDVFLNVGREGEADSSRTETDDESNTFVDTTRAVVRSRISGLMLISKQFQALVLNNFWFTRRNWSSQIVQILFPLIFTFQAIYTSNDYFGKAMETPFSVFSLNNYGKTEVFLHPGFCPESLIQSYKKEIESTKSTLTVIHNSGNLQEVLLQQGVSNIEKHTDKIIVAAEFKCHKNSVVANAMYSHVAENGFPISVNIMSNALLKYFSKDFSIISSHDLHKSEEPQEISPSTTMTLSFYWLLIPAGVMLITSIYIPLPLFERLSKSKHMKLMTGVSPITYWLSHFLWDILTYLFIIVAHLTIIIVFDSHGLFRNRYVIGVFLIVLILHGFAAIPFTYVFSFLAGTESTVSNLLLICNTLLGIGGSIAMYFIDIYKLQYLWLHNVIRITDVVLHLIPIYTLSVSMMKWVTITILRFNCKITNKPGCEEDMSYFAKTLRNDESLTMDVMYFVIECLLFSFILLLIEYGFIKKVYTQSEKLFFRRTVVGYVDDDDVKEEECRVERQVQGIESTDKLLVYKLVKKYRNFTAVKGITFGVREGECFGLLGVNGAGKTTTFQMLTCDIIPTSGKISAFGYKISTNKWKYLSHIGYCPQFDALDNHLTGYEILSMYAKLRGIPEYLINIQIHSWINILGLNEYSDKICGDYSGGNKRKLSAAVALIGCPPIVFLDEPTTGVDPVSRRKLWNVIQRMHDTEQISVLTSHSMEECEALCTRLAIMVAGQLMCMGNIQYLKLKFGQGFTVMIKMMSSATAPEINAVKSWFQEKKFPNMSILKDEHLGLLRYKITDPKVSLKELFKTLEGMKKSFEEIEDYAVSETSLEEIFLSFARRKTDSIP